MSTYLGLNVHIVFATKGRSPMIVDSWLSEFHSYIGGVVRGLGATPIMVGGTADHLHLLVSLRGSHSVAEVVREVKKASSAYAKTHYVGFSWQEGYGAFTVSPSHVSAVTAYIANQKEHHRTISSSEELRAILDEYGIVVEERFFQ